MREVIALHTWACWPIASRAGRAAWSATPDILSLSIVGCDRAKINPNRLYWYESVPGTYWIFSSFVSDQAGTTDRFAVVIVTFELDHGGSVKVFSFSYINFRVWLFLRPPSLVAKHTLIFHCNIYTRCLYLIHSRSIKMSAPLKTGRPIKQHSFIKRCSFVLVMR